VLRRGLATRPEERYRSMSELLGALGRACPPHRRRRVVRALVATLAGLAVVGAVVLGVRVRPRSRALPPLSRIDQSIAATPPAREAPRVAVAAPKLTTADVVAAPKRRSAGSRNKRARHLAVRPPALAPAKQAPATATQPAAEAQPSPAGEIPQELHEPAFVKKRR
jgi:hypothetical protein